MGSNYLRVGNFGSSPAFTFTPSKLDTGPIPWSQLGWSLGTDKFNFQISGPGTGYQVTLYGTFHYGTAMGLIDPDTGLPYAYWFQLPGAPTDATGGQWYNPMLNTPQASALNCKAGLVAFRGVAAPYLGQTPTGNLYLRVFITS
jgi:hypothetical protein